jgi:hypothetical protein
MPAYDRTAFAEPKLVRMAVRTAWKVIVVSDRSIDIVSVKVFFMRFGTVYFEGPDKLKFTAFGINSYGEGLFRLFASTHNSECFFTYWSYFCHSYLVFFIRFVYEVDESPSNKSLIPVIKITLQVNHSYYNLTERIFYPRSEDQAGMCSYTIC